MPSGLRLLWRVRGLLGKRREEPSPFREPDSTSAACKDTKTVSNQGQGIQAVIEEIVKMFLTDRLQGCKTALGNHEPSHGFFLWELK